MNRIGDDVTIRVEDRGVAHKGDSPIQCRAPVLNAVFWNKSETNLKQIPVIT